MFNLLLAFDVYNMPLQIWFQLHETQHSSSILILQKPESPLATKAYKVCQKKGGEEMGEEGRQYYH